MKVNDVQLKLPVEGKPTTITLTPTRLLPPARILPWQRREDPDFHLGYVGAE